MNINPKIVGVENDKKVIADSLISNNVSPKIVISDNADNKALAAIAQASTGYNNLYAKAILPSVPNFLVIPIKKTDSSFFLIDNNLIISRIDNNDLQVIAPIIGFLFVKDYFGNKIVRHYPKVIIMNNLQYQRFREEDNIKKIKNIDEQLIKTRDFISTISASIENDNLQISKSETTKNVKVDEQNAQYKKCINYYETSYCKSLLSTLNKNSNTGNPDFEGWNKQLELDKSLLAAYNYFNAFYKVQRNVLLNSKNVVPYEQGVFEPEDKLKLRLDTTNTQALEDFLSTLIHEYFHYASYSKGKKFTSSFFEEGMTEYFSRQVISQIFGKDINLGYPIQSKIIAQISTRIAENELINIYFSKDDKTFQEALDRVYGDGFYIRTQATFDALQYASTPSQLVKLANDIMGQIGGKKFTEKDFYSTN